MARGQNRPWQNKLASMGSGSIGSDFMHREICIRQEVCSSAGIGIKKGSLST